MSTVTSIVIVDLPKSLTCFVGSNTLDLSGGRICILYADGSFKTISMTQPGVTVSLDADKEGPTLATVSYEGQSQMFQVYVRTPVIRKFMVDKAPDKVRYLAGEKLDLTGLRLTAVYENGEKVPFTDIPPKSLESVWVSCLSRPNTWNAGINSTRQERLLFRCTTAALNRRFRSRIHPYEGSATWLPGH